MENNFLFLRKKRTFMLFSILALVAGFSVIVAPLTPNLVFAESSVNTPKSATIRTNPTKLTYLTGETFDPTGLSINVSCNSGDGFVLTYNNETASKFEFDTTPLTASVTEMVVTYVSPNVDDVEKNVSVTIPLSVDSYRIDGIDLSLNSEDRVIYSMSGAYGADYEDLIGDASVYLVSNGDAYRYNEVNPVVTPVSEGASYGTFTLEMDVTNIQSCATGTQTALNNRYWSHFVMGSEDKDIKFPNLTKKNIVRESDPTTTYVLDMYKNSSSGKYIPILYAHGEEETFEYAWSNDETEYENKYAALTRGYMPYSCDLNIVDNRVLWTVTAKYKGYETAKQIERALAFNLHGYVASKKGSDLAGIASKTPNSVSTVTNILNLEMNSTESTFSFSIDITDYETNYLSGSSYYSYFFRLGGSEGTTNDAKTPFGINHNKEVEFNGRKYIVMNKGTSSSKTESWGCLGFKITEA